MYKIIFVLVTGSEGDVPNLQQQAIDSLLGQCVRVAIRILSSREALLQEGPVLPQFNIYAGSPPPDFRRL